MDLHFEAGGSGEPLIILHGLFGSLENWHSISRQLSSQFKVFAVDQRNHGRSAHNEKMDYSLMAGDVLSLMRSQKLTEAFVLGHSMGGKTAMQLALLHPEAVKKLVVVDIAPRAYSPRHLKLILGMRTLDLAHFQSRKDMEAALAPATPDVATRQFLLKNVTRSPSGGFQWRIGLEQIHQNYSHLIQAVASVRPFSRPALFIRGEKSDFLQESDLGLIQQLFPSARLETVAGAGHLVHVEQADAFLRAVRAFLAAA